MVVWATPSSSPSCLWVRPRRRRCAARAASGVLLDLSIILTLLVLWVAPSLTRCKGGLKRRTLTAAVGSYYRWFVDHGGSGRLSGSTDPRKGIMRAKTH